MYLLIFWFKQPSRQPASQHNDVKLQLLPLGQQFSPTEYPLTASNQSRDTYPDGEKRFDVLDHRDIPTPSVKHRDIPTHYCSHFFSYILQISSGLDANCLFWSFFILVPVSVKNYSPNDFRFQLVENMAKFPQCYFVSFLFYISYNPYPNLALCTYQPLNVTYFCSEYEFFFCIEICQKYIT